MIIGVAVPLLCTLLIGWLQWHVVSDMLKSRDIGRRIRDVQLALGVFRYSLSDAESCQFRYILTHNDANLSLYRSLMVDAKNQFTNLRMLTADDALQQNNLDQMEPLVKAKEQAAEQSLSMEQGGNHAGALQIVSAETNRQNMLDIESVVENMQKVEFETLRARQNIYSHNLKITSALSVASMAISLGCIVLILSVLRRLARAQTVVTLEALREMIKYQDGKMTIEEYLQRRHEALSTHGEAQIEAEKILSQLERSKRRSATQRVSTTGTSGGGGSSTAVSEENPPSRP